MRLLGQKRQSKGCFNRYHTREGNAPSRRNPSPHDVDLDHQNRQLVKLDGEAQPAQSTASSVRQAGWPPLTATSRTPKVGPRHAARWFRDRARAHLVPATPVGVGRYRPKATGAGVALVVLVGFTTLTVAWISVWWVSAYLALMALIFVTPHGRSRQEQILNPGDESAGGVLTALADGLRVDRANEADHHHLAAESVSGSIVGESTTDIADFSPDSTSSTTAKPRRGRSRPRKVARTAAEPMPGSAAVTWIRVGPGKFVRADANGQAVDQAQTEEVYVEAHPAMDAPGQELRASSAHADALVERDPSDLLEVTSGEEKRVSGSDNCVPGSVVEEYGITPSAFSSIPPDLRSVEGLEHDVSEVAVTLEADSSPLANLGGNTSRDAKARGRLGSRGRPSASRVCRALRGIASAIPSADRASLRRNIRRGPKPRTLIGSSDPPNARLWQAAHRAFGRLPHVQRALRPRSPPYTC